MRRRTVGGERWCWVGRTPEAGIQQYAPSAYCGCSRLRRKPLKKIKVFGRVQKCLSWVGEERLGAKYSRHKKALKNQGFLVEIWRRRRDSNSRTCYSRRFSRPTHKSREFGPLKLFSVLIPLRNRAARGLDLQGPSFQFWNSFSAILWALREPRCDGKRALLCRLWYDPATGSHLPRS